MQVDLFSDSKVMQNSSRLSAQIESRRFSAVASKLQQFPVCMAGATDEQVAAYKEKILALAKQPRVYERIGGASCDNLWELELLGIGEYTKEWMLCVDFSDALDFAMEKAFGCNRSIVRDIPNYSDVSKRLMRYEVEGSTEKLDVLFQNDDIVRKVYVTLLNEMNSDISLIHLSQEQRISNLVFRFYAKLLETVASIRDYVATQLQMYNQGSIVYRSKTYCSAILTSDVNLTEDVILCSDDAEDYLVSIKGYKLFDWAMEVVINETSRNIYYR